MGITENNLVEASFTKDDLLERILSPLNLNAVYKRVVMVGDMKKDNPNFVNLSLDG